MTWQTEAACKGKPWQWWIEGSEGLPICQSCPAQADCLADILGYERRYGTLPGIYGGCTQAERKVILRRRGVPGVGPGAVTLPIGSGKPPAHGTVHAYRVLGCRCRECREAVYEETRRRHGHVRRNRRVAS